MTYTPTSPTPLLDPVLKELGTEIISGKIPAGQRFTLQDLCTRFGISRTVAREVMRALEQLNLVHASRRVGITVLEKKDWAVFDKSVIAWRLETPQERDLQLHSLTQLRIAVEPIAARAAANNANPEERTRLVELSTLICDLGRSGMGNSPDFLDADIEFHTLILTSSRNEMFASLASTVATVLTGRAQLGLQPNHPSDEALDHHERLAAAIASGEGLAAEDYARMLVSEARESLAVLTPASERRPIVLAHPNRQRGEPALYIFQPHPSPPPPKKKPTMCSSRSLLPQSPPGQFAGGGCSRWF